MKRALAWAGLLLAATASSPDAETLSEGTVSPKPEVELVIGVAPLPEAAPEGTTVPDVATRLAHRLDARPGVRALGPHELGGVGDASVAWLERASRAGAVSLVTGSTTQLGGKLSIDLRVTGTQSGAALGTYVEEAAGENGLDPALERLAAQIVDVSSQPGVASESAPPPSVSTAPAPRPQADRLRREGPIEIRSEELEVLQQEGGRRRILFRGDVRAAQEGVTLQAERLEASYPADARQPDRLEAAGGVIVEEVGRDRRMMCDAATYFRREDRVVCRGRAEMRQGADRVRGETIEIALDSGTVRVRGGVELSVRGRSTEGAP